MGNKIGIIFDDIKSKNFRQESYENINTRIRYLEKKLRILEDIISKSSKIIEDLKKSKDSSIFPYANDISLECLKERILHNAKFTEDINSSVYIFTIDDKKLLNTIHTSTGLSIKELLQSRNFVFDDIEDPSFVSIFSSSNEIDTYRN